MPYDSLTHVIGNKWNMKFSKAKITIDLINVVLSLALCLVFIQSFGAIGIGTFVAAYGIGKIVGVVLHTFQPRLKQWVFKEKVQAVPISEELITTSDKPQTVDKLIR